MKKFATLISAWIAICATCATAQILGLESKPQLSISAQGARQFGGSILATDDKYGLQIRSLGSAWDVGAIYRAYRLETSRDGVGGFLDLGGVVYYGSQKTKGGASVGYIFGDSDDLNFWVKASGGNFWSTNFGFTLGRLTASGTRGNYFGDRADFLVRIDKNRHFYVGGGWSSLIGYEAQFKTTWTKK